MARGRDSRCASHEADSGSGLRRVGHQPTWSSVLLVLVVVAVT